MDVGWQFKLIVLLILLLLSGFFSAAEVALFSLDKKKIKSNFENRPLISRYLLFLLEYPRRLLVTILIGNNIVNVAISITAVTLALEFAALNSISVDLMLTIQIILVTVLVILFGELIPKVWAAKNSIQYAALCAVPLYWISVLLYPMAETLTEAIKAAVRHIKFDKRKSAILADELTDLADLGHERGTIVEEEHGLIQSIVNFRSVAVHEVMTPRVDMVSLPADADTDTIFQTVTNSGHSRIPVYKEDLDEIAGILYAKDLLPYLRDQKLRPLLSLTKLVRKAMFIPRTKMINDLLHEFQDKKMHIAIVVDEYGGTAGLITLEDILEEIIGEIRDEYDKEENPISKIDEQSYMALGKLSIYELSELLNIEAEPVNGDYETLGGMLMNQAGQIPKEGYSFSMEGYKFTVKEVFNKRIKKVLIEKIPGE